LLSRAFYYLDISGFWLSLAVLSRGPYNPHSPKVQKRVQMTQGMQDRFGNRIPILEDRYGRIVRAVDSEMGTGVILDIWRVEGAEAESFISTVREEVDRLISADVPSIPILVDVVAADDEIAMVWAMEDFVPLSALLAEQGALSPELAVDIAHQIAVGLSRAEAKGIVHHDLSPNCVWVARQDKAAALRLTRYAGNLVFPAYTTGFKGPMFWGTPEYMAPELCSGKEGSSQSDIYSLGILLLEMLTGKAPFKSSNPRTTMKRQIYDCVWLSLAYQGFKISMI
jgi:serine/threonine protein kinase